MKIHLLTLFLLIAIISSFLGGCATASQVSPSPIPFITQTHPTLTPVLYTPSRTRTVPPTYPPTLTPNAIPTLSTEAAYTYLDTLLNNSSCRLPCWLGITPGKSSLPDAHAQLIRLSGIARSFHGLYIEPAGDWSTGIFLIPHPDDNKVIEIGPSFLTPSESNIISVIGIHALTYRVKNGDRDVDIYDYPAFNELMKTYTLEAVLSRYGLPKQIYIYAVPSTPLGYFQLHVWYPDQGIFLIFNLLAHDLENSYRLCPKDALLSGYLTQPDSSGYQESLLQINGDLYKNFFPPSEFVKTTDEAFGLSTDKFYQSFVSPNNLCLDSPKSVWPVMIGP